MTSIDHQYETYSDTEIQQLERLGAQHMGEEIKDKKHIKQYIKKRNLEAMRELAEGELEADEYLEAEFDGSLTALNYLGNMTSAEYAFMMLAAYNDVPVKYHVYLTTKKMIVYEIGKLNVIGRQYVFDYGAIRHFKGKSRKDYVKLFFKVDEDKYDAFRTSGNWLLYPFVSRRIGINIFCEEREILLKFIQKKVFGI